MPRTIDDALVFEVGEDLSVAVGSGPSGSSPSSALSASMRCCPSRRQLADLRHRARTCQTSRTPAAGALRCSPWPSISSPEPGYPTTRKPLRIAPDSLPVEPLDALREVSRSEAELDDLRWNQIAAARDAGASCLLSAREGRSRRKRLGFGCDSVRTVEAHLPGSILRDLTPRQGSGPSLAGRWCSSM